MIIRFLCNAGLAIEYNGKVLMIDLPNAEIAPFYMLPEHEWQQICMRQAPYLGICGFFFTHSHADHMDKQRLEMYTKLHPNTEVFLPDQGTSSGRIELDEFSIEYQRFAHAPIPNAPPHVVALITAGEKTVYISADAELNQERHMELLQGRKIDAAIWTPMYLSHETTRSLLNIATVSFINHLPQKPNGPEIWKKLEKNVERYLPELQNTVIVDHYPTVVTI